jgi:hypothetical protein
MALPIGPILWIVIWRGEYLLNYSGPGSKADRYK